MTTSPKMAPLSISAITAVTALGRGLDATWDALSSNRSGLAFHDLSEFGLKGTFEAPVGLVSMASRHRLSETLSHFDCRNNRLADIALKTDGFADCVARSRARHGAGRIAVVLGTSTSGILSGEAAYRRRDPATGALPADFDYTYTQDLYSLARFVATVLELRGPTIVISTACASSASSFLQAARLIAAGFCDAAVVGGADSLCGITLQGFAALGLISAQPCRPCDAERDGISLGEAAGFALIERVDQATTSPSLLLLGYGATNDGHHMSHPDPRGTGAVNAMHTALQIAGSNPEDVDYLNLHGTGSRANDATEDHAVAAVFGTNTPCSSTKGWTGHTLGAAGIVEVAIATLCLHHQMVPGCLGLQIVDPSFRTMVLPDTRRRRLRKVMSNSFGFGGINCSLLLGAS